MPWAPWRSPVNGSGMPEPAPAAGEEPQVASETSALRELVALIDAGELTASSAQRAFLVGAIAAREHDPLVYK